MRCILIWCLLLLTACSGLEPVERPLEPLPLPGAYSLYSPGEPGPDQWWESFDDPELDRLVQAALAGNLDIRTAWARLAQARAEAVQAGAGRSPSVDMEGSGTMTRKYSQARSGSTHVFSETEAWTLGPAASYEVDLWNRMGSEQSAGTLEARAARQDVEAAAMTVAAEVVDAWVDLLEARAEAAVLRRQVAVNEKQLQLQELRFRNGLATALDVTQQREVLAGSRAELPLLLASERLQLNRLAALLGRASPDQVTVNRAGLPEPEPMPAAGLPTDLLARRPDVRAAGLRLRSADWSVAAARADRLPSLTLSARAVLSSANLGLLLDNWLTSLAATITGPILDGGRRAAEVDRTRAVADQRLAEYGQVVLEAIREVEDGLVNEQRQQEYLDLLSQELEAARQALVQAQLHYVKGASDYLSVLTETLNVQSLERKMAQERADLVKYRVALHRVLGGGWTGRLQEPAPGQAAQDAKQ